MAWLSLDDEPLILRKEVIYTGEDFIKGVWLSKSEEVHGIRFDVTQERLEEMASQVAAFNEAGQDIPFTAGHAGWQNPANRLGSVVGARVLDNSQGKAALYLDVRFDSEEIRDAAVKSDVSIGLDDQSLLVAGKSWSTPLVHLASTDVPVIQELEPWTPNTEETMDLAPILSELNLSSEDGLLEAVQGMKTKLADLESKVAALPKIELSQTAASPVLVKGHADLRKLQLSNSVAAGKMAPAVKAALEAIFCTEKQVGLELSNGVAEQFTAVVELVELASQVKPLAETGRTAIELSHEEAPAGKSRTEQFLEERAKAKAEHDKKYAR